MWLRLLLKTRGVVTVFAFGGAKSVRRFCGCLDIFNQLSCRIDSSNGGELLTLQEAVLEVAPQRLRRDWRRMGMAHNCLHFTEIMVVGGDGAEDCFQVLADMRALLEGEAEPSPFLPLFFRLRLASALGYAPALARCRCGARVDAGGYFLPEEGHVYCCHCLNHMPTGAGQRRHWLSPEALRLLTDSLSLSPLRLPLHEANAEPLRQCGGAINDFVEYHLGITWENGGFRRV